jgi:hypothetical protein
LYKVNTTNLNPTDVKKEMEEGYDSYNQTATDANMVLRDLEEKQRILKERIFLIGQNLVEMREKTTREMLESKKDIETIKESIERIKEFLETASGEFQKFARKEDLEILSKQAKMFQPLEFVRKKDLEKFKLK